MKVNILRDRNGKVIATYENPVAGGPSIKPILRPGYTVQEVEAAENYKEDLKALYEHHSRIGKNRQS